MKKKIKMGKWYSYDRLIATGCSTLVAVGGRRIGKTWGAREMMIECASKGKRFVYMRKHHAEITIPKMRGLFAKQDDLAISMLGGRIDFARNIGGFVNENDPETLIGYRVSLDDAYQIKGNDFINVGVIFFDEFLDDDMYQGEFEDYQNVIATITSTSNDAIVVLAANSITRENTYFRNFGVDIARMRAGDIAIVRHDFGASVAVEYCASRTLVRDGKPYHKYVGFDHSPASKMILLGEWEHPPVETKGIDGITWASERCVMPFRIYISGRFFEIAISPAEVAFIRVVNHHPQRLPSDTPFVVTSDFAVDFRDSSGMIVPKWATFRAIGSADIDNTINHLARLIDGGRYIGVDPLDTYDFLRWFKSIPK